MLPKSHGGTCLSTRIATVLTPPKFLARQDGSDFTTVPTMNLSIGTLIATIVVASLVSAASIAAVAFRRNRELLIWSGALVVHAFAYLLFALRGQISDA